MTPRPVARMALRSFLASPWTQAAAVGAVTLVAWLHLGLYDAPIFWDRAYFTYLGQSVVRGDSIYARSFMGYPPLGSMVLAASMEVGRWFGVPDYLAPRHLAVLVGAASAALLTLVTRRATGSGWAGVLAGLALASVERLAHSASITLEPKVLLLCFTLVGCVGVQARATWLVGLAGGLAVSCWQPGVVPAAALALVACWDGRARARQAFLGYGAGLLAGLAPALLYLAVKDAWLDFWLRAVSLHAVLELSKATSETSGWLGKLPRQFASDRLFFLAAGVGFCGYAIEGFFRRRGEAERWLSPAMGGLPPLTLGWIAFNSVEFDHHPDMFPSLLCVGFWSAWLARRLVAMAERGWESLGGGAHAHLARLLPVFVVCGAAIYGFSGFRARSLPMTLEQQVELVREIVASAGDEGEVMTFSADAVLAISGRRSPNPFLRLAEDFMPFLPRVEPRGCQGLLERMLRERPAVVVVRLAKRSSDCERSIGPLLLENGYRGDVVDVGLGHWTVYRPDPGAMRMPVGGDAQSR